MCDKHQQNIKEEAWQEKNTSVLKPAPVLQQWPGIRGKVGTASRGRCLLHAVPGILSAPSSEENE